MRAQIGLAGQYAAVDENLTGAENLEMVGRLYHLPQARAARPRRRAARALRPRRRRRPARPHLLGRHAPPPRPRRRARRPPAGPVPRRADHRPRPAQPHRPLGDDRGRVAEGTTVLLTTQYLDEADRLADRIAVIDHGRVIAEGTLRRAQGPGRRRAARGHARAIRGRRRGGDRGAGRRSRPSARPSSDGVAAGAGPRSAAARSPRRCAGSTRPGSAIDDIALRRRRSTTSSSTLTGHAAGAEDEERAGQRRARGGAMSGSATPSATRWCSPSAACCGSRAHPTCCSPSPCSRSCSCCSSSTSSAARSRRPATSYVDFLMPGIIVQTMAFGGFVTALGLADDLKKGLIDRFRSLPMSRCAVLAGRTLADVADQRRSRSR